MKNTGKIDEKYDKSEKTMPAQVELKASEALEGNYHASARAWPCLWSYALECCLRSAPRCFGCSAVLCGAFTALRGSGCSAVPCGAPRCFAGLRVLCGALRCLAVLCGASRGFGCSAVLCGAALRGFGCSAVLCGALRCFAVLCGASGALRCSAMLAVRRSAHNYGKRVVWVPPVGACVWSMLIVMFAVPPLGTGTIYV